MKTYQYIACIMILGMGVSCFEEGESSSSQVSAPTNSFISKEKAVESTRTLSVTYESAAVYAGMTEYAFKTAAGETLLIRGNSHGEPQEKEIPLNLIDPAESEGPPGENPAMVGKKFILHYNAEGEVFKISPEE